MDVIEFLERIGQRADLRYAGRKEMGRLLESADLSEPQSAAILDGDEARLRALLGQATFMSVQLPADEEEGELDEELPGRHDDGPAVPADPVLP
jgi:hypothetical protein